MICSMTAATRKAIGIVRVSQPHGREGESFSSPIDQRAAIERLGAEHGWRLLDVYEEMKSAAIAARRPSRPVASCRGRGNGLGGDHRRGHDRAALVEPRGARPSARARRGRGGRGLELDQGLLSNGNASRSSPGRCAPRRTASADSRTPSRAGGRSRRAPRPRRWRRGRRPARLRSPRGRRSLPAARRERGTVPEAFRAARSWRHGQTRCAPSCARRGIERSYHGVIALLSVAGLPGRDPFRRHTPNLTAHPAIVDRETWRARAARQRPAWTPVEVRPSAGAPRGPPLRNLRLADGRRHVAPLRYWLYRCPPTGDCKRRVTISADLVEGIVVDAVKRELADAEGRASAEANPATPSSRSSGPQATSTPAIRAFAGLEDEPRGAHRRRLEPRQDRARPSGSSI